METIEARSTFLFIPFHLKPCTNQIERTSGGLRRDGLYRGDTLLAVNGRLFTGTSVYHQELRAAKRYLEAASLLPPKEHSQALSTWPFRVTVRSGTAEARTVDVYFAHCTCGSLNRSEVFWYCILPPAICILLGLGIVVRQPSSALAWLFLAMAVCSSHVAIMPARFDPWSQSANPLEWRDWFRVPAIAYQSFFSSSWPAWLLLFAVYGSRHFRPNVNALTARWAVTLMLVVAGLKAMVAIGSSEYFRAVAALYRALDTASTETNVILFSCAAFVTWSFGKLWRWVTAICALAAGTLLYWPASAPASYETWVYNNKLEAVVPTFHRTAEVVGACFTAAVLLAVVAAGWKSWRPSSVPMGRRIDGLLLMLSMISLLVPFVYWALSSEWWLVGTRLVPQIVLAFLYAGVLGAAWFVLRSAGRDPGQRESGVTTN